MPCGGVLGLEVADSDSDVGVRRPMAVLATLLCVWHVRVDRRMFQNVWVQQHGFGCHAQYGSSCNVCPRKDAS